MLGRLAIVACVGIVAVTGAVARAHSARAAFPGRNGLIVITTRTSADAPHRRLYAMTPSGASGRWLGRGWSPAWSPDGRRIVFQAPGGTSVMNADGSHRRLLTPGAWGDSDDWSPDGRQIVTADGPDLSVIPAAGGRSHTLVRLAGYYANDVRWSPAGGELALSVYDFKAGHHEVTTYDLKTQATRVLSRPSEDAARPSWSPDGTRVAYVATPASGGCNATVVVAAADGSTRKSVSFFPATVTRDCRDDVAWSPDGKLLAFTEGHFVMTMRPDGSHSTIISGIHETPYAGALSWQPLR